MKKYLQLPSSKILSIRTVDYDAFDKDYALYDLFECQDLLEFLTPKCHHYYPMVVCEFYANLTIIDSSVFLKYKTMMHMYELVTDKDNISQLMGWDSHDLSLKNVYIDFLSLNVATIIRGINNPKPLTRSKITSTLMKKGGKYNEKKGTLYAS